jgi:hypothetical protein
VRESEYVRGLEGVAQWWRLGFSFFCQSKQRHRVVESIVPSESMCCMDRYSITVSRVTFNLIASTNDVRPGPPTTWPWDT